ncbi:MAG: DHH family phosphoesterase [Clostridia bacterium]|nr:DHH family phosphoesterase [Clostridia bacterium]
MNVHNESGLNNSSTSVKPEEAGRISPLIPLLTCGVFGFFFIIALILLSATTEVSIPFWGSLLAVVYFLICGGFCIVYIVRQKRVREQEEAYSSSAADIAAMFRYKVDIPYALISGRGVVKVVNKKLQDLLGFSSPICNVLFTDLFDSLPLSELASIAPKIDSIHDLHPLPGEQLPIVTISGRSYELSPYRLKLQGQDFYFALFNDVTSYIQLSDKTYREDVAIAYIVLDNLEELAQYIRVSYRSATAEIENLLKQWALDVHGMLREYDRDKFLMAFSREELDKCIDNQFADILESIRDVKLGDQSFPVTISMGIAMVPGTMQEREQAASAALDVAVQRGGDQVVLRKPEGFSYFGGRVKPIQSNTSIISRVNSGQFCALVKQAGNVLLMGHNNPDFDAIGSCIGLARLALSVPRQTPCDIRIIMDLTNDNFKTLQPLFQSLPEYEAMFIDREAGLDLIRSDTLLVMADVNSLKIVEAPDVANSVVNIAIIDHHRQVDVYGFTPVLSYIHPTASSASELAAEMLEQSPYSEMLKKEEATAILAGIMLDTKNFTHNAGAQTFAAVHYLYSRGAHTNVARWFFREQLDERLLTSDMSSHAQLYRDKFALAWQEVDHELSTKERIAVAKVADNMLTIVGVAASFAIIKSLDGVAISGRSADTVNVQLILERLGGGGHFDMAGAQLTGASLEEAKDRLKEAIDDYLKTGDNS